VTIFLNENLTP